MRRLAEYVLSIAALLAFWALLSFTVMVIYSDPTPSPQRSFPVSPMEYAAGRVKLFLQRVCHVAFSPQTCEQLLPRDPYKTFALPPPWEALRVLVADWEELGRHFAASGYRVVVSLLLSLGLATPLGLVLGHERAADRWLSPLVYTVYPVPKVVFLPLLFVFLGLGNAPKIALITLTLFFQVLISARDAAKNVSRDYIVAILSTGASKRDVYRHVIFPASLPAVLSSARVSVGIAIAALALTESWGSEPGLWAFISQNWILVRFSEIFAGVLAMALLGLLLYIIIDIVERVACRWSYL